MEEEFRDFFYGEDHVRGSSPGCSSSSSSPAAEIVYQTVRREIYAGPNSREAFVSREVTLFCFPHPISWKRTRTEKKGGFFSGQKIIPWLQTPFTTETITIFLLILPKIRFFPKDSKWFQNLFLGWDQKLMGAWIGRTQKPLPWIHSVWKSPKMSHFNFNAQNCACRSV